MSLKQIGLPPPEELEHYQDRGYFEEAEVEELEKFRPILSDLPLHEQLLVGRKLLRQMWPDELTYISKTCWITTKEGERIPIKPNYAQIRFYEDVITRCREERRPIRGVILKARQLGMSTFMQAWQYVQCESYRYRNALTVSYDDDSTKELFQKTSFIHSNHWFPLPTRRSSGTTIQFDHPVGSTFYTKTAGSANVGRSFTIQHAHLSEVPMWDNPAEVMLGLKQAVPMTPESSLVIESTAKGRVGLFFDTWDKATKRQNDFIPFFAPWYWDPQYSLPIPRGHHKQTFLNSLSDVERGYMTRHNLTLEQMNWRRWKIRNDMEGQIRRFRQEMPADAEEAFLTTGNPVFNPETIAELAHGARKPEFEAEILLVR